MIYKLKKENQEFLILDPLMQEFNGHACYFCATQLQLWKIILIRPACPRPSKQRRIVA